MSTLLKLNGAVVGALMIISGLELNSILGLALILSGIFQCCFSWLIADTYSMVKEIKGNNLPYLEDLITYTKNQVKEINKKLKEEKEEE